MPSAYDRAMIEAEFELDPEDLVAAEEVFDKLVAGTQYPPASTKIGPFAVRYMPGQGLL